MCEWTPIFSPFIGRKVLHISSSFALCIVGYPMSTMTRSAAAILILGIVGKSCLGLMNRVRKPGTSRIDWGIFLYGVSCLAITLMNVPFHGLYPLFYADPLAALTGCYVKAKLDREDHERTVPGSIVFFVVSLSWALWLMILLDDPSVWLVAMSITEASVLTLLERTSGKADNLTLAVAGHAFFISVNTSHVGLMVGTQALIVTACHTFSKLAV